MKPIARLLIVLAVVLTGCAMTPTLPPLRSEAQIDLPRFMGAWHVIANIPYWPERGKVATRDEYTLLSDGRVENTYVFRKDFDGEEKRWQGTSRIVDGTGNAHWKVRFIWPFTADSIILEVDPEYRWALLGDPKRTHAWIFSRDAAMDAALYADLRERFRRYGYDPADLLRIAQVSSQVGQPGFQ